MSNQTFIDVGPYWDVLQRHRRSFYFTLLAGLTITALALVAIPKQYTSSVLLEVWHADIQQNLIGAEPETGPANTHLDSRLEALSEETLTHDHLAELIAKHGLYLRDGKPDGERAWRNGQRGIDYHPGNGIAVEDPKSLAETASAGRGRGFVSIPRPDQSAGGGK
jgi:hypothetical protein